MASRFRNVKLPIDRMRRVVEREAALHEDLHVPLRDLEFEVGDSLGPPWRRYTVRVGNSGSSHRFSLTPTSLRQLAAVTGVPEKTFHILPAPLGVKVLRTMVALASEHQERPRLVRLRHGRPRTLRAILPASFVRLDAVDIVEEVVRRVGEAASVWNFHLDPDVLAVRVVTTGEDVKLGDLSGTDRALPALDVLASETGTTSLRVRCVMIRVVCVNGLTTMENVLPPVRLRHTSAPRERLQQLLGEALEQSLPAACVTAERLAAARTEFIENPQHELERLLLRHRLGGLGGRIGRIVWPEIQQQETLFGVTCFDFVQALTSAARGFSPATRRLLEDAARDLITPDRLPIAG